jgi:hypothetical protein
LSLPDKWETTYLLKHVYGEFEGSGKLKINIACPVFEKAPFAADNVFVKLYGSRKLTEWKAAGKTKVIDKAFFAANPELKG